MLTRAEVDKTFEAKTVQVGERTYHYWVKTPSNWTKGKALPVVLSAHGFGFPAWMYLSQIKMHEIGEKEGFIPSTCRARTTPGASTTRKGRISRWSRR
jgi:hypothetical protein